MTARDSPLFFEKAPVALIAIEADSLHVAAANEKALSFLGYSGKDVSRIALKDLLAPIDLERVAELLVGNSPAGELLNCQIRDAQGGFRETDIAVNRLAADGVILFAVQDASARGRVEEQLRQSQKMEALGLLAGGIAHDFNNLLTIISGYSQMLQISRSASERDRTALEQVLKASERAADLTAQLLAFSRRQSIQPRVLNVNRLVDQTAELLSRLIGENIDLRVRKADDAGSIHADPAQIQQMLLNLAINARDAMPHGGTIFIQTRAVDLGAGYIGQHFGVRPGKYVLLEVADTGTGMDEATRRRAFEPFFTTKPVGKGTGLGLSTVYGIVKQFGGSIDLYTESGQGATFRVYLPRVEETAGEEPREPAEERGGHETLLLVEDEEGVRRMVLAALERCGYHVLVAGSGGEALDVARAHHGPIHILLTDMVMPRMNGRELAEKLLQERPSTAVLYMSGYPGDALQCTGALGGREEFLQKPFAPIVLTAKVREILDRMKNGTDAAHHS
jgi:signal transduction histidine kinase/CheY-like chemotaxis protein